MTIKKAILPLVCLAVASCAGTPRPDSQMAVASARVSDADRDGGMRFAPDDLTAARAKLDQARQAIREGNNKQAERLAGEAAADAELADVKARAGAVSSATAPASGLPPATGLAAPTINR